eukprot:TRINITY_DN50_c0_g1_i2.p1 TRINITY_DN50_c0_g1~~TRINITY_DN50_c0_g1_i2.p1  ORF type:complete len:528 (+),score=40.54 TRINITY_DN50_c0_g1_i2:1478-3061(+)
MALLSGLLLILALLALSLTLADALHKAINPAVVPKSFVRRQLIYAFLLLPIIDLFARIWLLQPFLPILALGAFGVTVAFAAIVWILRNLVSMANQTVIVTHSIDQVVDYLRNNANLEQLAQKCQDLGDSMGTLFSSLNYTQLFQDSMDSLARYQNITNEAGLNMTFIYTELLNDVSRSPVIVEMRTNLSSIINDSLNSIQFTDFVRNGTSYWKETMIFDDLKQGLISIVNNISLDNVSSIEDVSDKLFVLKLQQAQITEKFNSLRRSLGVRAPEIVANSNLSQADKHTLDEVLNVISGKNSLSDALSSLLLTLFSEEKQVHEIYDADHFLPINARWVVAILAFLAMIVPLMYIGRALLQSLIQWHLSKTYRDVGNEGERKIDGYILTGGVTGIGFGAGQAVIQSLLWVFAPFSAQAKIVLLVHCAMLMVIHCVTQMGISSAEGRRDLIRRWSGRKGWWISTTVVHLVTGMWWTVHYVGTLLSAVQGADVILGFLLVGDAVVLALFGSWAKNICHRARTDVLSRSRRE